MKLAAPSKEPAADSARRAGHAVQPQPRADRDDSGLAATAGRCACGGGCPRCRAASGVPPLDPATVASAPPSLKKVLEAPGRALDDRVQSRMENLFAAGPARAEARTSAPSDAGIRLGAPDNAEERNAEAVARSLDAPASAAGGPAVGPSFDFSGIRVHDDAAADAAARRLGARAFTVGPRIVFAAGQFAPETPHGDRLLAHEFAHSLQQRSGPPRIARSVTDWLTGSVHVEGMTYTQVLGEIDELAQWLERQIESSADTVRIENALAQLRQRAARLEAAARGPTRRERRRRRGARAEAPLPARYPRILLEMTSVAYTDPAEMREEYDLIMQWLARDEISADQRRILTTERDNLAPQLRADRERVVTERHAARLGAALTPAGTDDARALESLARTIMGISGEPANPDIFYIYHQNERITISRAQAERLRADLSRELGRAARQVDSRAEYYWGRYSSQLAINRDSPIISGISGWLADVEDPGDELMTRYFWIRGRVRTMQAQIAAGRMVEAAAMMPSLDHVGQEIRSLARAFYEGYIEGAEMAVHGLEITRDVSFAIAGSIAAVVAAPVVAGAVGAGGLGLTGVSAAAATTVGTGTVVGGGMAVVRGGSAAGGTALAGGSLSEVGAAFRGEAWRGFREGFMTGAAGGFARVLGPALGVGTTLGAQALRRVAAEMIVNGTAAMADALINGHSIGEAAQAGLTAAVLSVPGGLLGGSENPAVRYLLAPFTSGATAYAGAVASGATREQAMQAAATAVASNLLMSSAAHGSEADRALEQRGEAIGSSLRSRVTGGAESSPPPITVALVPPPVEAVPPVVPVVEAAPVAPVAETALPVAPVAQAAPPEGGAPPRLRGATAEGTGGEFRYEEFGPQRAPTVESGRVRVAPEAPVEPGTVPAASARAAPEDLPESVGAATEGTATASRSPSSGEELAARDAAQSEEAMAARGPGRLHPEAQSPGSVAVAVEAGLPPEVYQSGTVYTGQDFPELIPDRPLPPGRPARDLSAAQSTELERGIAGRRPTTAPDPSDVQHTEFRADVEMIRDQLESAGAEIHEVAINRTQRSGDPADPRRASARTRPDVQLAIIDAELNGRRVLIEYDRAPGTRALAHARGILMRDPEAIVIIKIIGFD
jgi:Domain of unknown function (DUF4157)